VIFSHSHGTSSQERVQQAFLAWDSLRSSVDELERGMRSALVRFADGTDTRPDQLLSEMVARRRDCETAVRALIDAIAATRATDLPARGAGARTCVGQPAANEDGLWRVKR
jgi:hypothetical protein